jgi:hypothetical protein
LPLQGYRIFAAAPSFAKGAMRAARGERSVDVELRPLPVLSATLVDADGVPWTAARIASATGSSGDDPLEFTLTRRSYHRLSELENDTYDRARLAFDGATGLLEGAIAEPDTRFLSVWCGAHKLGETELESFAVRHIAIAFTHAATVNVDVIVRFDPPPQQPVAVKVTVADTTLSGTSVIPLAALETRAGHVSLPVPAAFAGRSCAVLVEAPGYVEHFAMVSVPDAGAAVWHEATLQPGGVKLRGRILGSRRRPPTTASVVAVNPDGSPLRLPAKAQSAARDDGLFALEDLPKKRVRLLVAAADHAAGAVEVDTAQTNEVDIELRLGRSVRVRFPRGVQTRLRLLDAADRPLWDDRLVGTTRHGNGLELRIDEQAVTLEAYDAMTGTLMDRGAITAQGELRLSDGR